MGNQESCKHYGETDEEVIVRPPAMPEDTQGAFHTLIRSGDHRRHDAMCLDGVKGRPHSPFWNRISGTIDEDYDLGCLRIKPPELVELRGANIRDAYQDYIDRLYKKHERESRYLHDKYTVNMDLVQERFRSSAKEPICAELEHKLYKSLRKNRLHPLNNWSSCYEYIEGVNKMASLCYRLTPESKRKQKYCMTEFDIQRATGMDMEDRNVDLLQSFNEKSAES